MNIELKSLVSILLLFVCSIIYANPEVVSHATFWNCEAGGMSRNSLAGVKAAFNAGFEWCELDVNYTKDGKIILFHDGASGNGHIFNDCNYDELGNVHLKNGENIPLLSDVLAFAAAKPGTKLLIELKNCKTLKLEQEFARKCVCLTKKYGLLQKGLVAFISFSANICKTIREAAPRAHVQFVTYGKTVSSITRTLDISGIDYEYHYILSHPSVAREVKEAGLVLNVWTCDNGVEIDKLIGLGADMLTSNNPLMVQERIETKCSASDCSTLISTLHGVDLGLNLEWADRNVGAQSETEPGEYMSWRDASKCRFNDGWRLPTMEEMNDLMNLCKWTWTTQDGIKGFEVEGKSGKSIFLPACGHLSESKQVAAGKWGYYWSGSPSTLFDDEIFGLMFGGNGFYNWYSGAPDFKFPVRLVR